MPVNEGRYSMNPQMGRMHGKSEVKKEEHGEKPMGEGKHNLKSMIERHPDGSHHVHAFHHDGHVEHTEHGSMEEAHNHSMMHFEDNGKGEENEPKEEEAMDDWGMDRS